MNGFGGHRIEGIGDKHVPWIHNVRNTDAVAAIDDEDCMRLLRLFNEPAGRATLGEQGVTAATLVARLPLLGISSIGNLLAAIKTARWFELGADDVVLTVPPTPSTSTARASPSSPPQRGAYTRRRPRATSRAASSASAPTTSRN